MNKYGNATQFAKWLGVSQPYTAQLKKAGKLVFAPDGKRIDFEASKQRIALFADVGKANNGQNAKPKRQPANDDVCLDVFTDAEIVAMIDAEMEGIDLDDGLIPAAELDDGLIPAAELNAMLEEALQGFDWYAKTRCAGRCASNGYTTDPSPMP